MSTSVKKAFDIITYISDHQGELTLSELGRKLNINKTTMFRYLETLEALDILERRDGSWFLGMNLFSLGHKVDLQSRIVERVHPLVFAASSKVNETLSFAGLIGGSAVYLDKVESSRGLQMRARIGDPLPFHCTALGKAILSVMPEYQRRELLERTALRRFTKNSITEPAVLKLQMEEISYRGYSLEKEELEPGLSCIAVPFIMERMDFIGAVSFSGASSHLTEDRMMEVLPELFGVAENIAKI